MLPPTLHFAQGTFVRRITGGNDFFEVGILRLDDLVCGISVMLEIAGSTELPARHRLHRSVPLVDLLLS
jgi:hypothetical protein